MTDIAIRKIGRAGRITLQRPDALNALTYAMILQIEEALDTWRSDDTVGLIIIDAAGDRAFCAGGDIADLYRTGKAGDFAYGQTFWSDEYRLNQKIHDFPKPVVSLLQGFTMGGGVGIGCHGSHRIVGQSSQIAMPECGIGLVPDVGGSMLLARAGSALGAYLGLTGTRMNAADAILAGFADIYVHEDNWPGLVHQLEQTGDAASIKADAPTTPSRLAKHKVEIDSLFSHSNLADIHAAIHAAGSEFAKVCAKSMQRNAPLSMACALRIHQTLLSKGNSMERALDLEYRFTSRAMEHGDFLEGIRAQIIDKDRRPDWQFKNQTVPEDKIEQMLEPANDRGTHT